MISRRQMLSRVINSTAACGGAAWAGNSAFRLRRAEPDGRASVQLPGAEQSSQFELRHVRLLDGPFKDAMQRDAVYMLKLDPDRFLSNFRATAGLEPKAPPYGGWESQVGRMLGHHLSACSMLFASTGDAQFLDRAGYIVNQLAECQKANGNGYVGGIPEGKRVFAELEAGKVVTAGSNLNGVHAPWYMMHKLFAGLRDANLLCGSAAAKRVLVGLSDWACGVGGGMSDEQFQRMLEIEHGGMNEVLADVSALTGQQKYLQLAARFNHRAVLDPLMDRRDPLDGLHANTQIPKIIGLARQYELTGDQRQRAGAEFFWNQVTQKRSYANGGNSDGEHFFPIGEMARHLHAATAETCNTYNMLKLTRHVFSWQPNSGCADYYERALYNHILASQDPDSGMMLYFFSMQPGHFKTFSTPFDSFWCCVGTGMENHAQYGDAIYFHDRRGLYVNLFIPSELQWKERDLILRQETKFPEAATTRLTFESRNRFEMALRIRRPYWATSGIEVTVNGKTFAATNGADGYLTLDWSWMNGDVVEIHLPMKLRLEPMPDDKNKFAVMYGPIVLGGALGTEGYQAPMPFASNNELQYARVPDPPVPRLASAPGEAADKSERRSIEAQPVEQWIRPVPGQSLTFSIVGAGLPSVTLMPLHALNRQRYAVYWDSSG